MQAQREKAPSWGPFHKDFPQRLVGRLAAWREAVGARGLAGAAAARVSCVGSGPGAAGGDPDSSAGSGGNSCECAAARRGEAAENPGAFSNGISPAVIGARAMHESGPEPAGVAPSTCRPSARRRATASAGAPRASVPGIRELAQHLTLTLAQRSQLTPDCPGNAVPNISSAVAIATIVLALIFHLRRFFTFRYGIAPFSHYRRHLLLRAAASLHLIPPTCRGTPGSRHPGRFLLGHLRRCCPAQVRNTSANARSADIVTFAHVYPAVKLKVLEHLDAVLAKQDLHVCHGRRHDLNTAGPGRVTITATSTAAATPAAGTQRRPLRRRRCSSASAAWRPRFSVDKVAASSSSTDASKECFRLLRNLFVGLRSSHPSSALAVRVLPVSPATSVSRGNSAF